MATNYDGYKAMKKYIVYAENLKEFCEKYHRADKLTDFNRADDYQSHKSDLEKYGYTIIPPSTSITGEIVSYYGRV